MTNERGLSHSVQWTLVFPVAVLVLMATLQWALVAWANSTALAAAQDGARAAATYGSSLQDGVEEAERAAANGSLHDVAVRPRQSGGHVEVVVTAKAVSVLPGVVPAVERTARAPVQQLTSN